MNEHPDTPRPDTPADTPRARGGVLRTPPDIDETTHCIMPLTSPDTVRTHPSPDTPGGVRVEYRATVPRNQFGAAVAEAFGLIAAATGQADTTPDTADKPRTPVADIADLLGYVGTGHPADTTPTAWTETALDLFGHGPTRRTADTFRTLSGHDVRPAQTAPARPAAGHPDTHRTDTGHGHPDTVLEPTSLLGQMTEAMLAAWYHRTETGIVGSPAEHCAALAAAALGHTAAILPPTGHHHVSGRCPACNRTALFLGDGGYVTCSHLDCPRPDAAADLLDHPPFHSRFGCQDCPNGQETTHP